MAINHKKGHFALNKMPVFEKNIVTHKGWFDDTLQNLFRTTTKNFYILIVIYTLQQKQFLNG